VLGFEVYHFTQDLTETWQTGELQSMDGHTNDDGDKFQASVARKPDEYTGVLNGKLSTKAPSEQSSATTYRFDPARPVPSCGGNVSSLRELTPLPKGIVEPSYAARAQRQRNILEPGGFNQVERDGLYGCQPPYLPLGSRADVLVFQSEPLTEPLEITGPIEVQLWVATSAPDTDFTAKLIDVYPPSRWYPFGYALNLTDSIMRLRYRNGFDKPEPATPGAIMPLTITLYPTGNRFMPGHRIRLDISSSNFPRFDVNPNTGEPVGTERRRSIADNTVFHQAGQASRIILPVIPG
jgi:predicted acyl esterase